MTTISKGYTDTPTTANPVLTLPRPNLNWNEDYRVTKNTGDETVMINLNSPLDRPEKVRLAVSKVANVYGGTDIDPSVHAPTKRGISILAQRTSTLSVTDETASNDRIDLPLSFHIVAKIPVSEHITADIVQQELARTFSTLFDTDVETSGRLNSIMRGSLTPKEL